MLVLSYGSRWRFYRTDGGKANVRTRCSGPGTPDAAAGRPSGGLRLAQGGGFGARPAVLHQYGVQLLSGGEAFAGRPALAVMPMDRAIDGTAAHQFRQGV